MSNKLMNKVTYIYWQKEAEVEKIDVAGFKAKLAEFQKSRKKIKSKTRRDYYDEHTYNWSKDGDYYSLYYWDNGYHILTTNGFDNAKNAKKPFTASDVAFDYKFREIEGIAIRKAFGESPKEIKRCIPKQFYWIDDNLIGKLIRASSIDASSQYPSGCYGKLPDWQTAKEVEGYAEPTEEYPFAFYDSGHIAIYGELDTHDWIESKYRWSLFRFKGDYSLQKETKTVLCKSSAYKMDKVWDYYYDLKQSADKSHYDEAKLILNGTIGKWHRKDDKKTSFDYSDRRSYRFAHIVAVAIARGNQKILDKIEEIGECNIIHVCVDGIIYLGDDIYGSQDKKIGRFSQEFTDMRFMMTGTNCYVAEDDEGNVVKCKHGAYDLLDGKPIVGDFKIEDLTKLSKGKTIGEMLWQEN